VLHRPAGIERHAAAKHNVSPRTEASDLCSIIFGGSSQDESTSPFGSPIGPELNTQNGRCGSS